MGGRLLDLVPLVVAVAAVALLLGATRPLPPPPPDGLGPVAVAPTGRRFDEARAFADLRTIVERFPGRSTGSFADAAAADWVAAGWRDLGLEVEVESFSIWGALAIRSRGLERFEGRNVVGRHPGRRAEEILFVAHRDIVPAATQGADDNGSGTAVLLELARVLTARSHEHTYVFLSSGAEEVGLGGAARYARTRDLRRLRLVVNLDMLGWADAPGRPVEGWRALPLGATSLLLHIAARDQHLAAPNQKSLDWLTKVALGNGTDSDVFAIRDIPTIFVVDRLEGEAAGRHAYHSADDTIDQVSAAALGQAGRFVEEFVGRVESGPALDGPGGFLLAETRPGGAAAVPATAIEHVPPGQVALAQAVVLGGAIAQPFWIARGVGGLLPRGRAARQLRYWGYAAAVVSLFLAFPLAAGLWRSASAAVGVAWAVVGVAGLVGLAVARARLPARPRRADRATLAAVLAAMLLLGAWLVGIPAAAVIAGPATALLPIASLRRGWGWRLLDVALTLPILGLAIGLIAAAAGAGFFEFFDWPGLLTFIGLNALIGAACVYAWGRGRAEGALAVAR